MRTATLRMTLNPPTEAEEQQAFFDFVALKAICWLELDLIFAVPNGAFLGANRQRYAARLKREGLKPGVPDIFVPIPVNRSCLPHWDGSLIGDWPGLFIEMKRLNASPSDTKPEQLAYHANLREQGYRVEVCKGWQAAWNTLCDYLPQLKGQEIE